MNAKDLDGLSREEIIALVEVVNPERAELLRQIDGTLRKLEKISDESRSENSL